MTASKPQPRTPQEIQTMFNTIAPTYDRLNHLLSFGLDIGWRKKAIEFLEEKKGGRILDIAAGSGDLSIDMLRLNPLQIVGTDFAVEMLKVFHQKIDVLGEGKRVALVSSDALRLPFTDNQFDVTMVAFGIRNFSDRLKSLKEMFRVLKPTGLTMILELTSPETPVVKLFYQLYSRAILPLIGKIISRHNSAYTYLPTSIAKFPDQKTFLALMQQAGFVETKAIPLTFGVATIYVGKKTGQRVSRE
jgi:demethylmenaquinone methyltransferase/2-methoxy-6-polyprenyl-1,4-benzoquinol methylase